MLTNTIHTGRLEVICGPMFSGKSEELIRRLRRANIAKQNVAVFKHSLDDRYDAERITSHNGTSLPAHATSQSCALLDFVTKERYHVIGIDEVQWYNSDIVATISKIVAHGTRVIVAGLDMDYRGLPFGPMPALLAMADSVTKLKAICTQCGQDAHFSQLLHHDKCIAGKENPILMGGAETYTARCRRCHTIEKPLSNETTQSLQT